MLTYLLKCAVTYDIWDCLGSLNNLLLSIICAAEEKVKDYKYYLRMWAKEKEPKKETIKDLPRMNQVPMIPFDQV